MDLGRCWVQLGTISVSPGSQSTCTNVCRIGCGAQLGAIGPIGLRPALPIFANVIKMRYYVTIYVIGMCGLCVYRCCVCVGVVYVGVACVCRCCVCVGVACV